MGGITQNHALRTILLVDIGDVTDTTGHRGDVDRGITTTDHNDLAGNVFELAGVEGTQEGNTTDTVLCITTRNRQWTTGLCTNGPEDRIVLFLQVSNLNVGTYAGAQLQLNTHISNTLDLTRQHLTWGTVAGDAVDHHATQSVMIIKDGGTVANLAQLVGCCQTRWAAADDRNLLAGIGTSLKTEAILQCVVTDKLVDGVDANKVLHLVTVTAVLARCRADTTHGRWERISLSVTLKGVIFHGLTFRWGIDTTNDVQPTTHIVARWTTCLTRWSLVNIGWALVSPARLPDHFIIIIRLCTILARVVLIAAVVQLCVHLITWRCHYQMLLSKSLYKKLINRANFIS